jgi:V8-like Glu-specific endopeptidase
MATSHRNFRLASGLLWAIAAVAQTIPVQQPSRALLTRPLTAPEPPLTIANSLASPPVYSLGPFTPPATRGEGQIGMHRPIPPEAPAAGTWTTTPGGIRIWRLTLHSPGARAIRLHFTAFSLSTGKVFVFAPTDVTGDSVHGPYTGNGPNGQSDFWSAIVEGQSIAVEYQPPFPGDALPFRIDLLSHNYGGLGAPTISPTAKSTDREAPAAPCHLDAMCYATYRDSTDAIAHLQFEEGGFSYLCTGWLINTRSSSHLPYLITNNHCIGSQAVANTLATFFRYRTAVCNGARPALGSAQSLGATYLAGRPPDVLDFSFLRLPSVPAGAYFLGWNPNKLALNAPITALGHPNGDYMRITLANITGGTTIDKFTFRPTGGLTEGGSSGSPWMESPGVVAGLHARGNAGNFADACRALSNGQLSGGGEWFAAIYPYVQTWLEDVAPCSFSLAAQSASFGAGGGPGSITVTASAPNCARTATTASGFISITAGASGTGSGVVTYSVQANTAPVSRTGTITVAGLTYTVNQAAFAPTCTPTPMSIGATASGQLTTSSCASQLRPCSYAQRFQFTGSAGQSIVATMSSTAFDTYLFLLGPTGATIASNDDGGAGTDSRIPFNTGAFTLPSSGTYLLEATSYFTGSTGSFSVAVNAPAACAVTPTSLGSTITTSLTTGDCFSPIRGDFYADRYSFAAAAGQQVALTLTSPTLDTYLTLLNPDGTIRSEDDDSAGNLNSRIPPSGFITLAQAGTYIVEASTFNTRATGTYTLTLVSGGSPPPPTGARLRAVTPCRLMDTRAGEGKTGAFGPPAITGGTARDIPIPQGACAIPSTATAFSLNITVVPSGPLGYLTVWPTGRPQPLVSTLNSFEGRVVANAATVPAGAGGSISVFVTNTTHVIIDINGYYE